MTYDIVVADGHDAVRIGLSASLNDYYVMPLCLENATPPVAGYGNSHSGSMLKTARPQMTLLKVRATFPTIADLLRSVEQVRYDAVILDLGLMMEWNPEELVGTLHQRGLAVVVYTSYHSPYWLRRAITAGIDAVADKRRPVSELADILSETISARAAGTPITIHHSVSTALARLDRAALSSRQREVLSLYASGDSAREVASKTRLSPETVNDYLARIRSKYATTGRPASTKIELYQRALEDGLVPTPADEIHV